MMRPDVAKLIVALILDIIDFLLPPIPGLELAFDIVSGIAAVAMFGWAGLFAFWETADPTSIVDGFVPTLTMIALSQMGKGGKKRNNDIEPRP